MKKLNLLLVLMMVSVLSFGQITFDAVSWVAWGNEPEYDGVVGYDENPYDKAEYTAIKAPADWTPIASVTDFDATWDLLGEVELAGKQVKGGALDPFDLGDGDTFGVSWKAVHDGNNLYVLLKYYDTNEQADDGTLQFEIMVQPTSIDRHEPTFQAGVTAEDMALKNKAYARQVLLGGGKAVFAAGAVTAYEASNGVNDTWATNEFAAGAFIDLDDDGLMFWNKTDGVIKAVLPMDFDGVLSYPTDPEDPGAGRTGVSTGDIISFEVKSQSKIGDVEVDYCWSSDRNNVYASNYYAGNLTLGEGDDEPVHFVFNAVNWVGWGNEPEYDGVIGYDENPYDKAEYTALQAPAAWTPISDVASFDATWDVLGESEVAGKQVKGDDLDPFDLGNGNTFGAEWKAVHDGENLYVLLKYYDTNVQADDGTLQFEIMVQPTSIDRHEPTFQAGVDAEDMALKNKAYARQVLLGGGKAVFAGGAVAAHEASNGVNDTWSSNEFAAGAFIDLDDAGLMFWDETDGVIKAVLPMDFDGVLSWPKDPNEPTGDRNAVSVGDVISFEVKTQSKIGDVEVDYCWSSDKNNVYASNYYAGYLTLSSVVLNTPDILKPISQQRVYVYNGVAYVKGSEPVNLEVYNVLGARVKSAQDVRELSLKELNNGIYLIRVNGEREAIKVVKY